MIADGGLPAGLRRNYKSALDAISRIQAEEGILHLHYQVVVKHCLEVPYHMLSNWVC
jgi:hypothetical protein